jgi:hypothetical protein
MIVLDVNLMRAYAAFKCHLVYSLFLFKHLVVVLFNLSFLFFFFFFNRKPVKEKEQSIVTGGHTKCYPC